MKNLKINGEITVPDEVSLDVFCEIFNQFLNKNDYGFSGFIRNTDTTEE